MRLKQVIILIVCVLSVSAYGQRKELTAEQKQQIAELQKQREEKRQELNLKNEQVREEFEKNREQRRSVMEQTVIKAIVDIKFKGRVADYDGNPVSNAVVSGYIDVYDKKSDILYSPENFSVKTDKDGYFLINGTGFKLVIENITKDGYESSSNYVFDYESKTYQKTGGKTLILDSDNPEQNVFQIRKRGSVDYLIYDDVFDCVFKYNTNKTYYPLLLDTWYDNYGTRMDYKGEIGGVKIDRKDDPDRCLEISCVFNEDKSEFDLKFKTVIPNSGAVLTRDFSNDAPESGYQPEVVFHGTIIAHDQGSKIYIFVQGPEKKFYSRMELEVTTLPVTPYNNEPNVSVRSSIYTNPQGRRSLEYDEKFNWKERDYRGKLNNYRHILEEQARENKEIFNVKEFKKMVDERYAGRNIELLKADSKELGDKIQKELDAKKEAELRAKGKWSDDPAERDRMKKEDMERAEKEFLRQRENARLDAIREGQEIEKRKAEVQKRNAEKEAAKKAADEKAAQEQVK